MLKEKNMNAYNDELVKYYGGYTTEDFFNDCDDYNEETEYLNRINDVDIDFE